MKDKTKAGFIQPMLLRADKLSDGPESLIELLCGGPHKSSSVALHVMLRSAPEGNQRSIQLSPAPHNSVSV
jgi:hypothetical protein